MNQKWFITLFLLSIDMTHFAFYSYTYRWRFNCFKQQVHSWGENFLSDDIFFMDSTNIPQGEIYFETWQDIKTIFSANTLGDFLHFAHFYHPHINSKLSLAWGWEKGNFSCQGAVILKIIFWTLIFSIDTQDVW